KRIKHLHQSQVKAHCQKDSSSIILLFSIFDIIPILINLMLIFLTDVDFEDQFVGICPIVLNL
ncbi:MAG: hypothetical protein AABX46_03040, partial [Thermoproteota archaeon]